MKIFLPFAPTMKTYSLNIQQCHFCDNEKWLRYEFRGTGYGVRGTGSGEAGTVLIFLLRFLVQAKK